MSQRDPTTDGTWLFEAFLEPRDRSAATEAMSALGSRAIPILERLFSGAAQNRFGVSYKSLGMPIDCALVAVQRLGPIARSLELHLAEQVDEGHPYAPAALGALGSLSDASVRALAQQLDADVILGMEAATALLRCAADTHPTVVQAIRASAKAARLLADARKLGF